MTFPPSHSFDFDPSCGLSLRELQATRPPETPDGFHEFWAARYKRTLGVDPQPGLRKNGTDHPRWHVFDIAYMSTGGFPIGGWLLLPRQGEIRRGLVVGHGYGGRGAPDLDLPVEETAVLFPCFRGMSRSTRAPISADPQWHVLHDIDKPERYIIGGCVEDLWVAVSMLSFLYPWLPGAIGYSGVSFGGGIGGLAVPYDDRIDRAHLSLPTFGHQALRLQLPSIGSARAVQDYQAQHGNAWPALSLHDSAVAAKRMKIPVLASLARFDPAVAPPCQFAIANALPPSKFNQNVILDAGHFDYDGKTSQTGRLNAKLREFFRTE